MLLLLIEHGSFFLSFLRLILCAPCGFFIRNTKHMLLLSDIRHGWLLMAKSNDPILRPLAQQSNRLLSILFLALWFLVSGPFISQMSRMPSSMDNLMRQYMHQPPRFRDSAHPDYVCHLQKSLCGLKQSHRAWFDCFTLYVTQIALLTVIMTHLYFFW